MRLGKDSKVAAIAEVPLFCRCSKKELREIAHLADEIDFPEGKVLTREGTRGREFFVILDGCVDVHIGGREATSLGPGEFFGEIALVSDVPRTATVTAATPVQMLVITDRAFRELLRASPVIQGKVLEAVASRLAENLQEGL